MPCARDPPNRSPTSRRPRLLSRCAPECDVHRRFSVQAYAYLGCGVPCLDTTSDFLNISIPLLDHNEKLTLRVSRENGDCLRKYGKKRDHPCPPGSRRATGQKGQAGRHSCAIPRRAPAPPESRGRWRPGALFGRARNGMDGTTDVAVSAAGFHPCPGPCWGGAGYAGYTRFPEARWRRRRPVSGSGGVSGAVSGRRPRPDRP